MANHHSVVGLRSASSLSALARSQSGTRSGTFRLDHEMRVVPKSVPPNLLAFRHRWSDSRNFFTARFTMTGGILSTHEKACTASAWATAERNAVGPKSRRSRNRRAFGRLWSVSQISFARRLPVTLFDRSPGRRGKGSHFRTRGPIRAILSPLDSARAAASSEHASASAPL